MAPRCPPQARSWHAPFRVLAYRSAVVTANIGSRGDFKCFFILTNAVKINIKSDHAQSFPLIYNTKVLFEKGLFVIVFFYKCTLAASIGVRCRKSYHYKNNLRENKHV